MQSERATELMSPRRKWATLQRPKDRDRDSRVHPLKTCKPFIENSRAVLIHRPRDAYVFRPGKDWKWGPHLVVHYLCGNGTNGTKNITFLDAPPADKLVCVKCEERAAELELPSASQIVGKHVHVGGVIAVRTCCGELT